MKIVNSSIKPPTYFVSTTGTGPGSAADPMGIASMVSLMSTLDRGGRFFLREGVYQPSDRIVIAKPGIEIYGSGAPDSADPSTRLLLGTSANSAVVFAGSGPYTATVTGTVRAVYFDDNTGYAASGARGRALKLTRNTGTPTTPGAGEWGQSGTTLYLGDNPATRTVRIVAGTAGMVISSEADDLIIQGVQVGFVAGDGIFFTNAQDSTQLRLTSARLSCVDVFGCWDDTLGSGNHTNNGIAVHIPARVEMESVSINTCDNDGLNGKQKCLVIADGLNIDYCGDDCASPHYGASFRLKNFELRRPKQYAGADGACLTVFNGASAILENGTCYGDEGVYILNSSGYIPSFVHATNVMCQGGDWGTGPNIGWRLTGRGHMVLNQCKAIGFQDATFGYGFYLDDGGLTNAESYMTLNDCHAIRNRVGVRTNRASATNAMRVDAANFLHMDNTTEISNAGASPLGGSATTASGQSTDANTVAGVTSVSFWID